MLEYNLQFFADNGDKTEEPTGKKLSDARKEGQVAKSREIVNCLMLFVFFLVIRFMAGNMGTRFINVFEVVYNDIPNVTVYPQGEMPATETGILFRSGIYNVLMIVLPIMLIGLIIAVVCDLMQVKWKPTAKPLKPKFSKLDPIKGFKRIISLNSLVELVKSLLKLGLIAVIAYSYIKDKSFLLFSFYEMPLMQAIALIGNTITDLGIRISAVYIIIAASDFGYQKWKFHKDMMMSKQEVKDEYKNTEGDPQVKGAIRRKMMEASRRRMMQELPKADVVITNPTHYAVAIKYEPSFRDAPYVLAKGEGYLAQRIKDVAKENSIEIVENKPVARMLYHNVEIGETVPPELYHLQGKI